MAICLLGLMAAPAAMPTAEACPMCQVANESTGDQRPRAYMVSILFMLAMPATVLTGFGIGFYRLSQKSVAPNDVDAS
jgi:hypothetical protein